MDETTHLQLPYILAAQSQKHVTHNEALRVLDVVVQLSVVDKDLATPPASPLEGTRYIVGSSPSGAWSGHGGKVAAWQDGAWAIYAPVTGWSAWVDDESQTYIYSGSAWVAVGGGGGSLVPKGAWSTLTTYATGDLVEHEGSVFISNIDANVGHEPDAATPASTTEWTYFAIVTGGGGGSGSVNPVDLVGVNATADTTNRLHVASDASLFSHDGAGHQLKINKTAASDTASVLFQTGFSGRAEFGLAGDDDFHVKVSADGTTWQDALVISRSTGAMRGRLPAVAPGGRLTLASATPVMTADVSGAATIYYTPYLNQFAPLYDGSRFVMCDLGGQLSQATSDTSKSPAAVASNSNYDLFLWDDAGTYRCTRGPAWSSDTARGTGSGTTELERVRGVLVNKQAITNGPAANKGTYVGTVRSGASSTINFLLGGLAAGGSAGVIGIWNLYNRTDWVANTADTTNSWSYTTASWRAANDSSAMRVSYVCGLAEDRVFAQNIVFGNTSSAGWRGGVGVDTTTSLSGYSCYGAGVNVLQANTAYSGIPGLGFHYISAIEYGASGVTFYGDNNSPSSIQGGLIVMGKC